MLLAIFVGALCAALVLALFRVREQRRTIAALGAEVASGAAVAAAATALYVEKDRRLGLAAEGWSVLRRLSGMPQSPVARDAYRKLHESLTHHPAAAPPESGPLSERHPMNGGAGVPCK
jgi:hypothetical protein